MGWNELLNVVPSGNLLNLHLEIHWVDDLELFDRFVHKLVGDVLDVAVRSFQLKPLQEVQPADPSLYHCVLEVLFVCKVLWHVFHSQRLPVEIDVCVQGRFVD